MARIILNIAGITGLREERRLASPALEATLRQIESYNKMIWERPYPFMELPTSRYQFQEIKTLASKIKGMAFEYILILGIGGSSLGTETIFNALLHPFHNQNSALRQGLPSYFILDNIDPHKINGLIENIRGKEEKTLLVVISKSGETPETISQFMIFKEIMEKRGGFKERVVIITDSKKGALKEIAEREGYSTLNVPEGVGGRFSVLTPVGTFPAALMDIDIDMMMKGADDMAFHIKEKDTQENMAMTIAAILFLMERRGEKMHVMMPYCERLTAFASWFRQLEAESLGKKGLGPTPIKSIGVTDQHSQLQLYVDGPKDKCIFLLYSAEGNRLIPRSFPYIEGIDYLSGKDLKELFRAEFLGTVMSLMDAGTPSLIMEIEKVDAYTLGALFFLFEMVITFMGHLYGIDPFDQPGVEQGKQYTKAIMGKRGLEERLDAIEERLSCLNDKRTQIAF